jgi:hypothetical protein
MDEDLCQLFNSIWGLCHCMLLDQSWRLSGSLHRLPFVDLTHLCQPRQSPYTHCRRRSQSISNTDCLLGRSLGRRRGVLQWRHTRSDREAARPASRTSLQTGQCRVHISYKPCKLLHVNLYSWERHAQGYLDSPPAPQHLLSSAQIQRSIPNAASSRSVVPSPDLQTVESQ